MRKLDKKQRREGECTKVDSPVYVQEDTPSREKEVEEETQDALSPPHIVMGIDSVEVDSTCITMDIKENPVVGYGATIVANITAYSNSDDEEKEKKKEEEAIRNDTKRKCRKETMKEVEEKKRREEEEKKRKEEAEKKKRQAEAS